MATNYNRYINSKGIHYISNSGSDENKKYHGGKAGDQSTHEWELKKWYSRPWTHVFRYTKNADVGKMLAKLGISAALNNHIGYDQYQRLTYWNQLEQVGYDPSKITVDCEEDCSAGVAANVKACGYLLNIKALQQVDKNMTSRNTVENLRDAGFEVLTDSKYLTSDKYLMPGDILLYINHHVAMNITQGEKASVASSQVKDYVGQGVATGTSKGTVNVRIGADATSEKIGTIKQGEKVEILEELSSGWLKIVYPESSNGYAYTASKYYDVVQNAKNDTTSSTELAGKYKVVGTTVNLRKAAGTANEILTVLKANEVVSADGAYKEINHTKWLHVKFKRGVYVYDGFVSSNYLRKED